LADLNQDVEFLKDLVDQLRQQQQQQRCLSGGRPSSNVSTEAMENLHYEAKG
jgi:hypothetical protein